MSSLPPMVRAVVACPRCHGALSDEAHALRCDRCRLRYAVRDGVPILLINEAQPVADDDLR